MAVLITVRQAYSFHFTKSITMNLPICLTFIFVLGACAEEDHVLTLEEFGEKYGNGTCTEARIIEIKEIENNCTKEADILIEDDWHYEWCIHLERILDCIGNFTELLFTKIILIFFLIFCKKKKISREIAHHHELLKVWILMMNAMILRK